MSIDVLVIRSAANDRVDIKDANGQTVESKIGPGGCGANIAFNLGTISQANNDSVVKVTLVTAVGGDFLGSTAEANLNSAGVDTTNLVIVPNASTRELTYEQNPGGLPKKMNSGSCPCMVLRYKLFQRAVGRPGVHTCGGINKVGTRSAKTGGMPDVMETIVKIKECREESVHVR